MQLVAGPVAALIAQNIVHPVVAVDLGFAGDAGASTGVAVEDGEQVTQTFAQSCQLVGEALMGGGTLVLEAPLSGLFSAAGNPLPRLPFEQQFVNGQLRPRYWYCQPGVLVALASICFLRRLSQLLPYEVDVFLYEGFYSFQVQPVAHGVVASLLRDAALGAPAPIAQFHEVVAGEGQEIVVLPDAALFAAGAAAVPGVVQVMPQAV